MVNGLLKLAYLLKDVHEALTKGSQPILYLYRRFLTDDRPLENPKTDHLAETLVHHLRGQAGASSK